MRESSYNSTIMNLALVGDEGSASLYLAVMYTGKPRLIVFIGFLRKNDGYGKNSCRVIF
jgi:hypothetical protein